MKWWQASLAAVLYIAVFTTVQVGWHWYISTGLPLAALMRHVYLHANRFGHLMFFGFPDILLPLSALSIGIGLIGRRQRVLFAVVHGFLAGSVTVITLPLYTHWLHPVPLPQEWPLYPWGWRAVLRPAALINLLGVTLGAISVQRGQRIAFARKGSPQGLVGADMPKSGEPPAARPAQGDYRTDAVRAIQISQERHCSIQKAVEIVDHERMARGRVQAGLQGDAGSTPRGEPSQEQAFASGANVMGGEPPSYTTKQTDGIILVMCGRRWSVEQAAKNFRIPPELLRERLRDFSSHCTPERLSAVLEVMREKGWTIQQAAKRFQVPEEALRQRVSETA